ncbi:unnamed protein product [Blepharisma stoltei]|uniref:Rab-GAP TBC domain-containing protein n=1 Tax=Blepharisma stoltei TaxID=1481888 RepID=A0AAU9IHF7_9CILI|nr:unnamed protein product [Blepharisma stoltei]
MRNHRKKIKSWDAFLDLKGKFKQKISILQESHLFSIDPKDKREDVWINLINPETVSKSKDFSDSIEGYKEISVEIREKINNGAENAWVGTLSGLKTPERVESFREMMRMFLLKRPDIYYDFKMNHIAAFIIAVVKNERRAFILFSHIIEDILPEDFWSLENRKLEKHTELRIFEMMAEILRPRLLNSLTAKFKESESSPFDEDKAAFLCTTKWIGEFLFSTLFTTLILKSTLMRIWDNIFIYGIEFIEKFALTLLSKYEGVLINQVKAEIKNIGNIVTPDTLMIAGAALKNAFISRTMTISVEKLIKKSILKPNYRALERVLFVNRAKNIERNNIQRLTKIRTCKSLVQGKDNSFSIDKCKVVHSALSFSSNFVSFQEFINLINRLNWPFPVMLNIFSTFDQQGNSSINITALKCGFAIICEGSLEEKLELCFQAHSNDRSGLLSVEEAIALLCIIETCIDERSCLLLIEAKEYSSSFITNSYGKIDLEEFIRFVTQNKFCKNLITSIEAISSNDIKIENKQPAHIYQIPSPIENSIEYSYSDISQDISFSKSLDLSGTSIDVNDYLSKSLEIKNDLMKIAHNMESVEVEDSNASQIDIKVMSDHKQVNLFDVTRSPGRPSPSHFNKKRSHEIDEDYNIIVSPTHPQEKINTNPEPRRMSSSIEIPSFEDKKEEKLKRGTCNRLCTQSICITF